VKITWKPTLTYWAAKGFIHETIFYDVTIITYKYADLDDI
jgi:hypothetical protein